MKTRVPRIRYGELVLLAAATVTVVALGLIIARDVRRSADDANRLYDQLSEGLGLIHQVLYETEEVRRILLYALHTSDANRQLQYAEESRAAEARVERLLATRSPLLSTPATQARLEDVRRAWSGYLVVRDDVIGLILEGSLPEGVALDEQQGSMRFNDVRRAIANLQANFEADAAVQVAEDRARSNRSMQRLTLLVVCALLAAAVGIYLLNRRAALEGVLRSEAHKGSILQAVPDPIISTDAQGHIIELNEAAEHVFGFSRADAIGRHIEATILAPDAHGVLAAFLSGTHGFSSGMAPRIETVGRRADGSHFPIELAGAIHSTGRETIWTVHVSDLTRRHQAEEHLRRAKESAELATRMKTEFLATMSHEVRTPLSGVVGIADLLTGADLPPSQRDLIRMLRSSANTLSGLVSNILDYSRIEAGLMDLTPVRFTIRTVIEDALDPVTEPASRKSLEIGYTIDADVPEVIADQTRVRQVLINLLSNAVKFTDAGEVSLRVSAVRQQGDDVVITIRVQDSGIGIPEHLHHRLFRQFSQIDTTMARQHGGTGLGLAISQRLSRLLGGSISVQSEEGRGSIFTFVFAAHAAPLPAADAFAGSLAGLRVMTVLKPGIVGEQIASLLTRWGVSVATTADRGLVDVVVMDEEAVGPADATAGEGPPTILVTNLRPATADRNEPEYVIVKPVRARALHEALCEASGRDAQTDHERAGVPPSPVIHIQGLTVLLVEDDDANRRVVHLMLQELGLEVDEARSGFEAINHARRRQYDVILMDVQMPGCDGLEATRQIRSENRGAAPLIYALTANIMEDDEARCRAAGMNGYLSKPLRLSTLASVLSRFVAQRT